MSALALAAVAYGAQQKPAELDGLLELVGDRRPRRVLEVGSYWGGTLRFWLELVGAGGLVVSIDRAPNFNPAELARADRTLAILVADSHAPATVELARGVAGGIGAPAFDLLFIDGDHSEAGVASDFEVYRRLVGAGGLVVLHDVVDHSTGVPVLWRELRRHYATSEIVADPRTWGGFGVVHL